jgi:hypothetical protein
LFPISEKQYMDHPCMIHQFWSLEGDRWTMLLGIIMVIMITGLVKWCMFLNTLWVNWSSFAHFSLLSYWYFLHL